MSAPELSGEASDLRALRESVALAELEHVTVLRVSGEGAFALLDRVSTAPLFLREGEMRQTLFLTDDARPFADVLIASDEDGFFVFAEGPSEEALLDYLAQHRGLAAAATVTSLARSHQLFGLCGPYAWELAAAAVGPSVLGMTYLTLLRPPEQDVVCFRAGKTGEYGYDLLVPRAEAATWRARLLNLGAALDVRTVGLPALDQAALENWHFNIRALPAPSAGQALTPIELQLQWRLGSERTFVGAEALRARRASGPTVRATCFSAAGAIAAGDPVRLGDTAVGAVLVAGWSHTRQEWVGTALLSAGRAHPGIDAFVVDTGAGPVPIRTRTPPLLDNRSLYVEPHRHTYATRATQAFPPLVPA